MKPLLAIFILTASIVNVSAQVQSDLAPYRTKQIEQIIELINTNQIVQLTEFIDFPIRRPDPIPDIENKEAFILYYSILFDSSFKDKITSAKFSLENTIDLVQEKGIFGLFDGEIWLNDIGHIVAINYSSPQELNLQNCLINENNKSLHSSIKVFSTNVLKAESNKFKVRIDELNDESIRLSLWIGSKEYSQEPDLILLNGIRDGGTESDSYIFEDGLWSYWIDDVFRCSGCEVILNISYDGEEKSHDELVNIK